MNARLFFVAVVGLLLVRAGSVSAEVPNMADLAPADALAYLELHDPPALARELHALIKGSYLQHPALLLANHMKRGKNTNEEALLLAWFASPEFIDELGDWQGGFLALTGLTHNDEPKLVGLLRTGRSRIFPLAVRMILLDNGPIRCIDRVEGVPIFQFGNAEERPQPELAQRLRAPAFQLARLLRSPRKPSLYQVALLEDAPVEQPEEKPESGFFVSLLPDAVAFGTTPDALSEVIRRYKNKSSTPSLATAPAFRAAAEMRSRPGFFLWSDPARLARLINDALGRDLKRHQNEIRRRPLAKDQKHDPAKQREELRRAEIEHRRDTREWTFFQRAANLAGMHYAAADWSLHKGEVALRAEAHMKEKQTSPLLDLLANQKISPDLLRAVPGDAFCLFAVPLTNGAALLARLMKLADAYAAESGEESSLPSKYLAEMEKNRKLRLGRDVFAKIRSAAVAFQLVEGEDVSTNQLLLLEAASEAAAKDLVATWPRLYAAGGKPIEPHQHTINGQLVRSLTDKPADASLTGLPPHYGCRGKIVVLGWHRDCVAAVLSDSTRKKDLLNLPRCRATVDAEGAVAALILFSCKQLLAHCTQICSTQSDQQIEHRHALNYLREMSTPMTAMPPTLIRVKRITDGIQLEFRQSELPIASATAVDIALTWMLDAEAVGIDLLSILFARPQPPPALPPIGALIGAAANAGVPIPGAAVPAPAAPAPKAK